MVSTQKFHDTIDLLCVQLGINVVRPTQYDPDPQVIDAAMDQAQEFIDTLHSLRFECHVLEGRVRPTIIRMIERISCELRAAVEEIDGLQFGRYGNDRQHAD